MSGIPSQGITYYDGTIYEYLENSFDELVWEWGYLSLIVGK